MRAAAGVKDYLHRALEIRAIASGIADADCRRSLLKMAEDYERMAIIFEAARNAGSPVGRPANARRKLN